MSASRPRGVYRASRALAVALLGATVLAGCAHVSEVVTGRGLTCPDDDQARCVRLADEAVRALDVVAPAVSWIEIAEGQCDAWLWWGGGDMPAVAGCWEVMAMTPDGWRRGMGVQLPDGSLQVFW